MTRKEKINAVVAYCEEHKDPIQDNCPELIQYWSSSKGKVYWSNKTGERTDNINIKPGMCCVSVKSKYYGIYIAYIPELDAMEFSHLMIEGNRGVDGVKKEWKYDDSYWSSNDRMFVFHGDVNVYKNTGNIVETNARYANKEILQYLSRNGSFIFDNNIIDRELLKFDKNYNQVCKYGLWRVHEWYRLEFIKRNKSKKVNEMTEYQLSDDDVPYYEPINDGYRFAWFELIDENYAVFRIFEYGHKHVRYDKGVKWVIDKEFRREITRVFISNKGKPTILANINNAWVVRAQLNSWYSMQLANPALMTEWKPIKYVIECLDMTDSEFITKLISILRHPIIETLIKSGYPKTAKYISRNGQIAADIQKIFGAKETKGSLYKVLGVNKYVLNKFEDSITTGPYSYYLRSNDENVIKQIKHLYGKNNICDLSNETIDLIYPILSTRRRCLQEIFWEGYSWYNNVPLDFEITEKGRNFFIKLCKMEKRSGGHNILNTFVDVRKIARSINNMPQIDLYNFKNENELNRLHDALLNIQLEEEREREAIRNAEEAEAMKMLMKKFDKLQPERIEKFEYEDDEFCIRMPKDPDDLRREGLFLNHCVGGYKQRHAMGDTNIIFLRRKAEEDRPFYTIEIRNDYVIQIHGSHNRWLGNNPEAIPFVYEWLQKIGVRFDKKVLLNKGCGYGASCENLPDSYLKRKE